MEDAYESLDVLSLATAGTDKQWILDSGCSFHMTLNKDWFEDFKLVDGVQVREQQIMQSYGNRFYSNKDA